MKRSAPGLLLMLAAWLRAGRAIGDGVPPAAAPAPSPSAEAPGPAAAAVITVTGLAGEPRYGESFSRQAALWAAAAARGGARCLAIGGETNGVADRDRIQAALDGEPKDGTAPLWLILIGHGSFDGKEARFNLRGPDLAASELALWLKPFSRPVAVIDTSSSSAPFLPAVSAPQRVVVTATRSGFEQNATRFGNFLAEAISDPRSDLDRDGQVSLLEAFLSASRRTAESYATEGRLASEHALLDDNGDQLGTQADWFRGLRAVKSAADGAAADGARAAQWHLVKSAAERAMTEEDRAKRDALELQAARLRDRKAELGDDEYYRRLEAILLELARLYAAQPPPAAAQ